MTERKVKGKSYKICTDAEKDEWDKISTWTASTDVEFEDGTTAENFKNNLTVLPGGTLQAGQTSLTITDSRIKTNSLIDIYTSVYGVVPKTATVTNGILTMTFVAQKENIDVKVRCW